MDIVRHPADSRGGGEYGWLSTRYSFSFANWHEPARMGFGALRVINDDRIAPGQGFGRHGHRDMEIVTLVTRGTLRHEDSLGNAGEVPAGEVQVMSAGTGILHAEFNASAEEPLELFQMWIETGKPGAMPRYGQRPIAGVSEREPLPPGVHTLVGPLDDPATEAAGALGIHQNAWISQAVLAPGQALSYELHDPAHGLYAFAIEGAFTVARERLKNRDAVGLSGFATDAPATVELVADPAGQGGAAALLFEVPMRAGA